MFFAYRMRRVKSRSCGVKVEQVPCCDGKNQLTTTYRWFLARWARRLAEALEKSLRAEKRQAAPFSKGEPEAEPRVPGRKPGAAYRRKAHRQPPAPVQIDEHYEAPLPDSCPTCGGSLEETVVASQYQPEIPRKPIHREFRVHLGFCTQCGQSHQGRHPLQTSDALGVAAAQLGPDAQAATVVLNKQAGLSHGKIKRVFRDLFVIVIYRGGRGPGYPAGRPAVPDGLSGNPRLGPQLATGGAG